MKLSVNDTVKNPVEIDPNEFLADLMAEEPATRTVTAIFVRDWTTEEKGYTKRAETTDDPDAIVYLEGCTTKYRLSALEKA
jgi:hypothetical protein